MEDMFLNKEEATIKLVEFEVSRFRLMAEIATQKELLKEYQTELKKIEANIKSMTVIAGAK